MKETPGLEDSLRSRGLAGRPAGWLEPLLLHARLVLGENDRLHLTTITDPVEFADRHVAESLAAADLIPAGASGQVLDLGSGNGYPAIPLAVARPGLRVTMTEASRKKAEFLRDLVRELGLPNLDVLHAHVQRPGDLPEAGPFAFLTCRAMGNWERVLPRLASTLAPDGRVLLWAGPEVAEVSRREVWKRYRLVESRPLPGLEQGLLWSFAREPVATR